MLIGIIAGSVSCSSSTSRQATPTGSNQGGPPPDVEMTEVAKHRTPGTPVVAPSLTDEDRQRAAEILRADSFLGPLLIQRPDAFPDGFGLWNSRAVKLGVGTDLHFDPPITLEHDWPRIPFNDDGVMTDEETRALEGGDYPIATSGARYVNISNIDVLIDLRRGEVVKFSPYKYESMQRLD